MQDGHELYQALRQFMGGGEDIYKHALVKSFNYTEGVREFAQEAGNGAYWLLDILATEPAIIKHIKDCGFALVLLKVTGSTALLTVADDSDVPPLYARTINFTDCPEAPVTPSNPEGVWKFYLEQSYAGDRPIILCMLPNEK